MIWIFKCSWPLATVSSLRFLFGHLTVSQICLLRCPTSSSNVLCLSINPSIKEPCSFTYYLSSFIPHLPSQPIWKCLGLSSLLLTTPTPIHPITKLSQSNPHLPSSQLENSHPSPPHHRFSFRFFQLLLNYVSHFPILCMAHFLSLTLSTLIYSL